MLQDGSLSGQVSEGGRKSIPFYGLTHNCCTTYDHTHEAAYPRACMNQGPLSRAQGQVMDLLLCTQEDVLTTEIHQLTRNHEGLQSTVTRLADRTIELETDVKRMVLQRSNEEDNTSRQYAGNNRQLRVDTTQPMCHLLSEDEGETLNPLADAQNKPDPWFDWLVASERLTKPSGHVTVRNLMVLEVSVWRPKQFSGDNCFDVDWHTSFTALGAGM